MTRDPSQAIPISGSSSGSVEDFLDMKAEVMVTAEQQAVPSDAPTL